MRQSQDLSSGILDSKVWSLPPIVKGKDNFAFNYILYNCSPNNSLWRKQVIKTWLSQQFAWLKEDDPFFCGHKMKYKPQFHFFHPISNLWTFCIFKVRLQVTLCEASRRKVKEGGILIPIHKLIYKLPVNDSKNWS